jgi:hypothetical protein
MQVDLDAQLSSIMDQQRDILFELHNTYDRRTRSKLYLEMSCLESTLADVSESLQAIEG